MTTQGDNVRPGGTLEVDCASCGWAFWVDPLDSRLPDGPFVCETCSGGPAVTEKAGSGDGKCAKAGCGRLRFDWGVHPGSGQPGSRTHSFIGHDFVNPAPDAGEAAVDAIVERWIDHLRGVSSFDLKAIAREAYAAGRITAFREAAGAVANVDVLNRDQLSAREKCADAIAAREKEGAK